MRPIILLAALLMLILPVSAIVSSVQAPTTVTDATVSSLAKESSAAGASAAGIPSGQKIVLRSSFGVAFYNASGIFVIVPATLLLNMTVVYYNATGISFSVDAGKVTVGSPTLCPSPYCGQRIFIVTAGQAFLTTNGPAYYGRLTIQAKAFEEGANTGFYLFLTGPARFVSPIVSPTYTSFFIFARLYGALYNSTTKIGLLFLVGSGVVLGDSNMDGQVDIVDLVSVAGCLGSNYGDVRYDAYADLNLDGNVDAIDLVMAGGSFGTAY